MEDPHIARHVTRAFEHYHFGRALTDLRPRRRGGVLSSVPRLAILGCAVVLAFAAWALSASPAAVGPTLGFADWRTAPDAPNAAFAIAAGEHCNVDASMRLVAHDQRGTAAALVFSGGAELVLCLVAQDSAGTIVAAASGATHLGATSGPLSVDTGLSAPGSRDSPGVQIAAGRAGAPIASVDVIRSDGVDVQATVSSGFWVAWWPGAATGTIVRSTDGDGAFVQEAPALN